MTKNVNIPEDCKQKTPKSAVFEKLNLVQESPEKVSLCLFKRAAARLVSSFSLTQKSCKTIGQGFKQGSEKLISVEQEMRSTFHEK